MSAVLHATAHGIYEPFLNGVRISNEELLPGFTAYRKRLQVHAFDVTDLVVRGPNAIGALLSDGWWRGQHSSARRTNSYGPTTALLAELHLTLASGEVVIIATDASWRSAPSHILAADVIAGEVHDLRRRVEGWSEAGTDRSAWDAVRVTDYGFDTLCAPIGPPCRRIEELAAVAVRKLAPGRHIVDFGKNSNGWIRLTDLGPAGTTLTIVYGEALDEAGDVTQTSISHSDRWPERSFQTDVVTSVGDGSTLRAASQHQGLPIRARGGSPRASRSVVDHERSGAHGAAADRRLLVLRRSHQPFACRRRLELQRQRVRHPYRLPHPGTRRLDRRRQVFVATAAYLYDVTDFSRRWLRDLAAEQRPDGAVLNYVPDPHDLDLDETLSGVTHKGQRVGAMPRVMSLGSCTSPPVGPSSSDRS